MARRGSAESFFKPSDEQSESFKLTPLPPLQPSRIPPSRPASEASMTPEKYRTPPPLIASLVIPTWDDDDDASVHSSAPTALRRHDASAHVSRHVSRQVSLPNFSPTKKLKLPPRPKPEDLHATLLSDSGGSGSGADSAAGSTAGSVHPAADGRASKVAMHRVNQVLHLYERYRKKGFGEDELLTFPRVLKKEFPLASKEEIEAMISFIEVRRAADEARRAKATLRWTADEKRALEKLFRLVDVDASGAISLSEFEELAALANLSRAELRLAYERASESVKASNRNGELGLAHFMRLIEGLGDESVASVRAILPGLLDEPTQTASDGALLVFDDGRQQLWRLDKECSRELVRKETREAEWQAVLTSS